MDIRFAVLPIVLVAFTVYSSKILAAPIQQFGSVRVSAEYDSNPAMDSIYRGGTWRSLFEPSYQLKRIDDTRELSAGLALQTARSSNKILSQDYDNPSLFIGWKHQEEAGEFGLSARYNKIQTRASEIDNAGPNSADNTRVTRALLGNWNEAFSERSSMVVNGAYNNVTYQGGSLVDYVTRSGDIMLSYAWNEHNVPFLKTSYADTESAGSNVLSRFANVLLGWNAKIGDYLEGSLQAGKSRTNGSSLAKQAVAEIKYKDQRMGLILTANRQVTPSGLGGFVTIDQAQGSWNYALSEHSSSGIDLVWRKNYFLTSLINRTSSVWLQQELNSRWGTRTYYLHKISERAGYGAATADILGIALVYTHTDF